MHADRFAHEAIMHTERYVACSHVVWINEHTCVSLPLTKSMPLKKYINLL